jgi:hypothetical protein
VRDRYTFEIAPFYMKQSPRVKKKETTPFLLVSWGNFVLFQTIDMEHQAQSPAKNQSPFLGKQEDVRKKTAPPTTATLGVSEDASTGDWRAGSLSGRRSWWVVQRRSLSP